MDNMIRTTDLVNVVTADVYEMAFSDGGFTGELYAVVFSVFQ